MYTDAVGVNVLPTNVKTFLSIKVDHISKEVVDEHTEYIVSVFVKITFNKRAKTKVWRDGIRRGARDWNDS